MISANDIVRIHFDDWW